MAGTTVVRGLSYTKNGFVAWKLGVEISISRILISRRIRKDAASCEWLAVVLQFARVICY